MKRIDGERGRAIGHLNKFNHAGVSGGRGGDGGHPVVSGGNDGSHSPYVQGGGGVTPLYAGAAGAQSNHQPHHGGGNRDKGRAGVIALTITAFAWFLMCNNQDL